MFSVAELLTHFHEICTDVENLALKSVNNINLPVCGSLTQLTSMDCFNLLKNEFDNWSNMNQPIMEKILVNYLITDYISCGLSSPIFHAIFHSTLRSNSSKIQLLKMLMTIWDCLLKAYSITCHNVEFFKNLEVGLKHHFDEITFSVPDAKIKYQCDLILNKIKCSIQSYEQEKALESQILRSLSNNVQLNSSNQKRVLDTDNTDSNKSKVNYSVQNTAQQVKNKSQCVKNKTCLTLDELFKKQKEEKLNSNDVHNSEPCNNDLNFAKKSQLISHDVQNSSSISMKSEADSKIILPDQKLNAFQVMMMNAKKHKTRVK